MNSYNAIRCKKCQVYFHENDLASHTNQAHHMSCCRNCLDKRIVRFFRSKRLLDVHLLEDHKIAMSYDEYPFRCFHCTNVLGVRFASKSGLHQHIKFKHADNIATSPVHTLREAVNFQVSREANDEASRLPELFNYTQFYTNTPAPTEDQPVNQEYSHIQYQ